MLNCTGNVEWIFFHLMVSESKYIRISFNGHYWNDINMYANLKSKLNFVCRNKPVPVVALLWSDISDLDLEKIVCHFFSTSEAVLPGPISMAVNETAIFRHVRLFISDVSDGPNFPLNICLFSSTRFVSVSVLSAFQLDFLFVCESIGIVLIFPVCLFTSQS